MVATPSDWFQGSSSTLTATPSPTPMSSVRETKIKCTVHEQSERDFRRTIIEDVVSHRRQQPPTSP